MLPRWESEVTFPIHHNFEQQLLFMSISHLQNRVIADGIDSIDVVRLLLKVTNLKERRRRVGLDYASDGLYVDSDGNICGYPKFYRKMQYKPAFEERKLSRMQKGSQNWEKQRIRVLK